MEPLRTVRVPPELVELFSQAEKVVSAYFSDRKEEPHLGRIEISGERYVLVRAASLSVEFFNLVRELYGAGREEEAADFARNILFDLAHAVGRSDAQRFNETMPTDDPIKRLAAGPVHFSHTGWAFVDIHPESRPSPGKNYYLLYDHPYSFEADAWIDNGETSTFPVCIMNAGYSSGWCEASYGMPLVASEVLCRARGDADCRFIMAHPERIESFVEEYLEVRPHLAKKDGYQIPNFFERKRIEEELRKAHAELELRVQRRTSELKQANENLQREMLAREEMEEQLLQKRRLESLGRLAGGIAHDFNNLLTVVLGNTEILSERITDPSQKEFLDEIQGAGEKAARITNQLLTFGRASHVSRETVVLDIAVTETLRMLERLLGEDIEIETKLQAGSKGKLHADRGQIDQVLLNLAVNARDAMPRGGKLRIRTELVAVRPGEKTRYDVDPGEWVLLVVSDTGKGMDEETRKHIFDPYFTTKEAGRGSGLGLATTYAIVSDAGGTISVQTEPDAGTRFEILFPRLSKPTKALARGEKGSEVPCGTETILVVEDEDAPRRLVVRLLESWGYTVIAAAHPDAALALVEAHSGPIDLLLSDVIMPTMSGHELAAQLRAAGHIDRVVLMSGYAGGFTLRRTSEAARDPVLVKPFPPAALAQAIRKALDD